MKIFSSKFLITLILLFLPLRILMAGPALFYGKAIDNKSQKLAYQEKHEVEYAGELVNKVVTTYSDPEGKEIAKLTSIFKGNSQLPDSDFVDLRSGYKETTRLKEKFYEIQTTDPKGNTKSGKVKIDDNLVCGQGYHNYIIQNLGKFKVGEKREIKFIIPSMRDFFTFDLTYLGPLDYSKPDEVTFRLDITNWILSIFADKIQVTYSLKDKTLLKYVGLTNLTNSEDKQYDATLTFSFP